VPRIALLPPEVSQKIAAGEVIERPSSVVKELVENSLDAGAASIRVELRAGGKDLIRVEDDGCGLGRQDALLAFERHSTSKIREEKDLENIVTLGFRGEALASISAVSRLTFRTSEGGEAGTEVQREGERLAAVRDIALARGTAVEVRDLFFNLPARLKFLKSETAELGRAAKLLTLAALAHPEVAFSLRHGRREVFDWPRVKTLRERLFQVHGKALVDRLMEIDHEEGGSRIRGFVTRPPLGRGDRSQQFFFVNLRPVKDPTLQAALNQAFRPVLEKDTFAEAFLFLTHPRGDVDVNVHPAKSEVRFRDAQAVFRLVLRGVEKAVLDQGSVKPAEFCLPHKAQGPAPGVREDAAERLFGDPFAPGSFGPRPGPPPVRGEASLVEERALRVLGQYLNLYIIVVSAEGLFVVDQHNAHERVLYERYKELGLSRQWPRRLALIPRLFDLSPSDALALEESAEIFAANGFRVEEAGGRTYALKEFPDILKEDEAERVFLDLLAEVRGEKLAGRQEKVLATLACRTAVKAGDPLSQAQMEYLVDELFKLPQHSLCPHGRPILLSIDRGQIAKGLRRPSN
jgi:DNA mismatch repair protein MutL